MPLTFMVDVLGTKTGFSPRTLRMHLHGAGLWDLVSTRPRVFLRRALNVSNSASALTFGQLYGKRWADDAVLMAQYRALAEDEQVEALVFVTLMLHESTHYLDFLSTPFGVNFYVKTIREYWNLQDLAPELLEHPQLIGAPLVDIDKLSFDSAEPVRIAWQAVRGQVLTFEAWGDGAGRQPGRDDVSHGWTADAAGGRVQLFGRELLPVTVHGFFATIGSAEQSDWYLRPMTVLETRAVANSLNWIRHILGPDARPPLRRYFAALYGRDDLPPDYLFLFDLDAGGWGHRNFNELLASGSEEHLDQSLMMLTTGCWYALHAPPPMDRESVLTSNPIVRLLAVLLAHDDFLSGRNHRAFSSFVEMANALDASERPRQWGCRPIRDILAFCNAVVDQVISMNAVKTWNPRVRSHFERILRLLKAQIGTRSGYESWVGMPTFGNPLFGFDRPEDAELFDAYEPPSDIDDWLRVRDSLLFRFSRADTLVPQLENHFGMPEYVINCGCGAVLSGRISRWSEPRRVSCPGCGAQQTFDLKSSIRIDLSEQ